MRAATTALALAQAARRATAALAIILLTATTAWAQNLADMPVIPDKPTVTDGQTSNWNANMETGENYNKLVDGNTSTKYGLDGADPWVEFHYDKPITPAGYALWTANDELGARNPKNWTIKAKVNSGGAWTTLVSVDNSNADKLPMANDTETRFALENSTAYQYFRFEATRNANTWQFQLAELQFLYVDDPAKLQYATVTGVESRYAYTGSAISITPVVKAFDGTSLTLGNDFTATLNGAAVDAFPLSVKDAGDYSLVITAKDGSGYTGSQTVSFKVAELLAVNLPQNVQHGTFTASPAMALQGDRVTITASWDEGYEFLFNSLRDADNNVVATQSNWVGNSVTYTFTMPATAVTFDATISEQSFWVRTPNYGEKFSITASPNPTTARTTVTLTIDQAEGVAMSNLKAFYRDYSGGGTIKAPSRRGGDEHDEEYKRYLELTKVSDTQYTFTMPAADVDVSCDVSYSGTYAINLADGLDPKATSIRIDEIPVTSANAGDCVWMYFNTSKVENLTVTGVTSGNAVEVDTYNFTFIMPNEAVTISATPKFQIWSNPPGSYTLTASVDGADVSIEGDVYIAAGKTVTLTAKSTDKNFILSYLFVNKEGGRVPLTFVGETSEEGYPHVYTYTFKMPSSFVRIEVGFGNPITVTFDANGGTGTMAPIVIGQGGYINLPECGFTAPEGYSFAGWTVPYREELMHAGEEVFIDWNDMTITAQWTIDLADATANTDVITKYKGQTIPVVLSGRTLYKDGGWNTLCLPFDVTDGDADDDISLTGTPLKGATVKELDVTGRYDEDGNADENGSYQTGIVGTTLYLYFKDASAIEAGKPYLVKWAKPAGYTAYDGTNATSCSDIVNPVFTGVTIDAALHSVTSEDNKVSFVGNYSPVTLTAGDPSNLYLGARNTLYWPSSNSGGRDINAFRAYFHVGTQAQEEPVAISAFSLYFGDDDGTTGIVDIEHGILNMEHSAGAAWYDLQGRKLSAQPTARGIYIHGGKKIVIK